MKLEEGRYYKFLPVKVIILPDANENLILTGPDSKKYLLPLSFYNEYDLPGKSEICCKVDKINCSGKVFLEPQHPYYKEGEYYPFVFENYCTDENRTLVGNNTFSVRDIYGKILTAPVKLLKSIPAKGSEIILKVERISKGRIYFSHPETRDEITDLTEGESYDFLVVSVEYDDEGEEFYIVRDHNNKDHHLPVKYYRHYGFKKDETFRGKIVRYSAGSMMSIEPENPWYSPGDIVEVTVGDVTSDEAGINYVAEVFDNMGFKYSVKCSVIPEKAVLRCTVLKIRKGRPVLVPLEDK